MESDWIDLALNLGTFGLSVGAMLVAWIRTRSERVDRLFEGAHTKLIDLDRRVQRLEDGSKALPTRDEVHAIVVQLTALNGKLEVLGSDMAGHGRMLSRVESVVSRHEDHLLENHRPRVPA